jgi:hypothetical protein
LTPQRGEVRWRSLGEGQWRPLLDGIDLPDRTDCLALDGSDVWVGGPTYVAVLDLNQRKIRTLCRTAALSVDRLEIAGGYLWAKFDWRLYRVPLSETR